MVQNLANQIIEKDKSATIDAILVVERFSPRPFTIAQDIRNLRKMWGKKCLKSVIHVIILPANSTTCLTNRLTANSRKLR